MYKKRKMKIHFVGIGGIGMSGIAEVLLNLKYPVTGSDLKETDITRRLAALGCTIRYGHRAEHVQGADVVVVSSAVRVDNPEVLEAKALMIPVIPRAEMLAELMRMKYGIAVAGTHGKTTTASMIATVLAHGGMDPTMVIGGRVNSLGSNAKVGAGDFLVAEADESDGTFLKLTPTMAIVTNIDPEHLDFYGSLDHLKRTFLEFINKVPFYGSSILCADHPQVKTLIPFVEKRYLTYGLAYGVNVRGDEISHKGWEVTFKAYWNEKPLGQVRLRMPGVHNVYNALATIACALEMELEFHVIQEALEGFMGVHRRFEFKGDYGGITVIDDYAHHPEEIRATLAAVHDIGNKRVIALFQPHRFSRTRDLFDEFLPIFNGVDLLFVTDIYPAGEEPIPGVTAEKLVEALRRHGYESVHYVPDQSSLAAAVVPHLNPGDLVITLGAGSIWQVSDTVAETLGKRTSE